MRRLFWMVCTIPSSLVLPIQQSCFIISPFNYHIVKPLPNCCHSYIHLIMKTKQEVKFIMDPSDQFTCWNSIHDPKKYAIHYVNYYLPRSTNFCLLSTLKQTFKIFIGLQVFSFFILGFFHRSVFTENCSITFWICCCMMYNEPAARAVISTSLLTKGNWNLLLQRHYW